MTTHCNVELLTGHNFLHYHKSLIDDGETNPMCRLCGQEPESSSHLLLLCPTLEEQRLRYLGAIEITDPTILKPSKLLNFIKILAQTMENADDKENADSDEDDDEDAN